MSTTDPVKSTPTAIDKQEEVRKLNLEIAGLTSAKDIADRAAKEAQEAAQDARTRAEGLETAIAELERSQTAVAADLREFVAHCRNVLQAVVSTMELAAQSVKDMATEVDRLAAEIGKRKKELSDLQDAFAKENAAMSVKREDLEIWEGRVREAAAVHLPGEKIII